VAVHPPANNRKNGSADFRCPPEQADTGEPPGATVRAAARLGPRATANPRTLQKAAAPGYSRHKRSARRRNDATAAVSSPIADKPIYFNSARSRPKY